MIGIVPPVDRPPPCAADPELFFSETPEDIAAAKQICYGCPFQYACDDYATQAGEPWGVWGGTSPQQRGVSYTTVAEAEDRAREFVNFADEFGFKDALAIVGIHDQQGRRYKKRIQEAAA